jgi:prolyl-tRNA synthetase
VDQACATAYAALTAAGKEPLLDDTDQRVGAKFAAMDLIGLPWQLIIGPKGLADGVVELKRRATGERQTLSLEAALKAIGA